jgi:hypothetical protein
MRDAMVAVLAQKHVGLPCSQAGCRLVEMLGLDIEQP